MGQVCLISGPGVRENNLGAPKAPAASRPLRLPAAGGREGSGASTGGRQRNEQAVPKRSVIGIGGGRHYTLYDPATDHIEFRIAGEPSNASGRGFG